MKIQMLVYPGMTLLDLVGPAQAWASWPDAEMQYVWKEEGAVPTDTCLPVVATTGFADAWEAPDILFTPGGMEATFELLEDDVVMSFLRSRGEKAGWVTAVCTGSILLGGAGLLRGYKATSHWFVRDAVALFGATPTEGRYVIDRNRATGGGVTAGVDFGLAIMAEIAGEPLARLVQLLTEYSPQPPFNSGTPAEALPETLATANELWGGERAAALQARLEKAAQRLAAAA